MDARAIDTAADLLWRTWMTPARIEALPAECRPKDRADGYEIQAAVIGLSGQRVAGWKIAATSQAGQRHINVDGPLAGPLLDRRASTARRDRVPDRQPHARGRGGVCVSVRQAPAIPS